MVRRGEGAGAGGYSFPDTPSVIALFVVVFFSFLGGAWHVHNFSRRNRRSF